MTRPALLVINTHSRRGAHGAEAVVEAGGPARCPHECGDEPSLPALNGRHYGGGMTVSEDASIDDGCLDLYSLEVESFWRLPRIAPVSRRGQHHAWAEIRTHSGDAIEIRTSRPRSVNTDGEIITQTPARFRVLRHVLVVYVPQVFSPGV
jgi:diacylglycerol kinase family enzyme